MPLPNFITMKREYDRHARMRPVFYADTFGEPFERLSDAVAAYTERMRQRDEREQAERRARPNRVDFQSGHITVFTDNKPIQTEAITDRSAARRWYSRSEFYDTHTLNLID